MKKTREITHLEHFKEIFPLFPEGEIEKSERPDFIVHTLNRQIGIEHTEIFQPGDPNGESLQAQDSMALRVVDKAYELYTQNHSQSLLVQILFKPWNKISKQDVDRIAETIVRFLETIPLEPNIPIIMKQTRENAEYFPREIAMIHIFCHNEKRWVCSSAGWIPELTPEQLQKKIDSKEVKLISYKLKCDEIWLLIVADDFRNPSTIDLNEFALTYRYRTGFDRVFFFWNSSRRFVELQLCRDHT